MYKSEDLDPTRGYANLSGAAPFVYTLRAFLSAGVPNNEFSSNFILK